MQPSRALRCPWYMPGWDAPPSFTEYIRSRYGELLRFAHVLTGEPHLAADLVQDALERAGVSWRRIQRQDDPEGWVRRVILNRYLNRFRALRRERLVASVPDIGCPPAPQRAMTGIESELRRVLHDDRLALPVPADPVTRVITGIGRRRRRRRIIGGGAALAVLAAIAPGVALTTQPPSRDESATGVVAWTNAPVAMPTRLQRRDPRADRRPCALKDLHPRPWTERDGQSVTLLVTNSSDSRCTISDGATVIAVDPATGVRGPVGRSTAPITAADRQYPATIDPGEPARIEVTSDPSCAAGGASLSEVAVVVQGREYPLADFRPPAGCPVLVGPWYVQPPLINAPLDVAVAAPDLVRPGKTLEYQVAVTNAFDTAFRLEPCPVYIQRIGTAPAVAYRLNCTVRRIAGHTTVRYLIHLAVGTDVPAGPTELNWTMVLTDGRVAAGSTKVQVTP